MNVPASMRSGMMRYSQPCSSLTPSMTMRGVPWPVIGGAALVEEVGQVDDLRLAGGHLDDGGAVGQDARPSWRWRCRGRWSRTGRRGTSRCRAGVWPWRQMSPLISSISAPSCCMARMCRSTGRSPMAQPPGMDDLGAAAFGEQRAEHADRGPHLADDVVFGLAVHLVARDQLERAVGPPFDVDAQLGQQLAQRGHVRDLRDVVQHDLALAQDRRGHDRQGRVLGPADAHAAPQPRTAGDFEIR